MNSRTPAHRAPRPSWLTGRRLAVIAIGLTVAAFVTGGIGALVVQAATT